ncbi:MAG: glycosyltransferase [Acidimicrobiia bacterium]|nr:glycosyltransferase [Acidimicrobiia bacterium]
MVGPDVSVCIPAYRAEPYLRSSIESVLAQTLADWELVIVDNASSDRTGEIARSYGDPRIVVHTNPSPVPLADNWNLAVTLCRGRLVKLLPADDEIRPECLELQVKAIDSHPGTALVACRRDLVDAGGRVLVPARGLRRLAGRHAPHEVIREIFRSGINPLGEPGAWLFRRADFDRVGGFAPDKVGALDLELATRLLRCGDLYGLTESLALFRVRGDSWTARSVRSQLSDHRQVLGQVAQDRRWSVSWRLQRWGLLAAGVAAAKRSMLYRAATGRVPAGRAVLGAWGRWKLSAELAQAEGAWSPEPG